MFINQIFEGLRNTCKVCGQTPCNCTHIAEEKVRLDPKCWKGKKIGNPKTKMKGGVRVNNCVPAESVEESADPQSRKLGRIISRIYNEIYEMGDDALDYLNDRAAVWAELWDRYEGDIDSIIAEEDPVTLGRAALELKDILNDLQSDQGVAEGFAKTPSGDYINMHTGVRSSTAPKQKPVRGYKWEVNFDYGPHQSTSVSVTASSENEACAKAEKLAAKNGYRSIMINWAKPADQGVAEEKVRLDPKCWKGKKIGNPKTKMKGGVRVNNCVPAESIEEGVDQTKEAGKAIQNLKNLAVMKTTITMQQLSQAGQESIITNAINAAKTLEQSYMANKQQGNAVFVRALIDEIDNFRRGTPINASFPETDGPSELGELLQGKLGKVNFQQGVAEEEQEANYGKKYQDTVKRAGHAVKNIEKKFGPVDISSLAKRLNDIEQGKK